MNLYDIRKRYIADKYSDVNASSRTCQDVLLSKIYKCPLSSNITLKGGVVISHISKDKRRATRDFDLDFIRYSLGDDSIKNFINCLNDVEDGVKIEITEPIEDLKHQEYQGKRVYIALTDRYGNKIETKLDIGIHSKLEVKQEDYCFELNSTGENVELFVNSIEQMFTEKLFSLLKLGRFSTRYKDIFDFYYFIDSGRVDENRLVNYFKEYIFSITDSKWRSIADIHKRLKSILSNEIFLRSANTAQNNWIELPVNKVVERILIFIKNL